MSAPIAYDTVRLLLGSLAATPRGIDRVDLDQGFLAVPRKLRAQPGARHRMPLIAVAPGVERHRPVCERPGELWGGVLRRKGGRFALLARMPVDPSVN